MTKKNPINIVQITDTHLYGTPEGTLLKMNTKHSLDRVIEVMSSNEKNIDLILATGDIAQDASQTAYERFISRISELNIPFHWIPGNHDDVTTMQKVAAGTNISQKVVSIKNWRFILLDSSIRGQVHGRIAPSELEFLEASLKDMQNADDIDHCIVCLHHNPVPGTAGWMRDIGLENGPQFFETIGNYPKVKSVIYAHIHQELDFQHKGVRCFCSPSTCIQFKPNVTGFELDRLNPGYRSFSLYKDGRIDTKVVRVTGETFDVDFSSAGY
jgi:3',5'-cyclic-AMP phosphodiesterase